MSLRDEMCSNSNDKSWKVNFALFRRATELSQSFVHRLWILTVRRRDRRLLMIAASREHLNLRKIVAGINSFMMRPCM